MVWYRFIPFCQTVVIYQDSLIKPIQLFNNYVKIQDECAIRHSFELSVAPFPCFFFHIFIQTPLCIEIFPFVSESHFLHNVHCEMRTDSTMGATVRISGFLLNIGNKNNAFWNNSCSSFRIISRAVALCHLSFLQIRPYFRWIHNIVCKNFWHLNRFLA